MNAMQLDTPLAIEQSPLRLAQVGRPRPGPQQLMLSVQTCGVCRTDLHTVEGDLELPKLPLIPGHQIIGRIEQRGEGAGRFPIGSRVGVGWLNSTCGICRYCRSGQENLCPNAQFTGLHVDGGYAAYALVHQDFAFVIPDSISDEDAAPLLCAGIIGYRSLRLSNIQPGQNLGLYGFGASAHLAIQVARAWDCQVYVFTRSPEHQEHARRLGAVWAGQAGEQAPVPLDASVTFAPAGWLLPVAMRHLRPGGTLAVNAIHMSPIPQMPYETIYHERILRSVANYTRQDAEEFLALAASIPVHGDIVTFPLRDANLALQQVKTSGLNGAAVLQVA